MSEIKERLNMLASYLSLSIRELERKCSLKRGAFSGKSKSISSDSLSKLADTFQEINIDWLLNGKGEMIKEPSEVFEEEPNKKIEVSNEAWNIIKTQAEAMSLQAKSLERRDSQISDLIELLKKDVVLRDDIAKCAGATGSEK